MLRSKRDNSPDHQKTAPAPQVPPAPSRPSASVAPNEKSRSNTSITVVGENMQFVGDMNGTNDLVIAGNFKGNISLPENQVTIQESGNAEAKIQSKSIVVKGHINGELIASDTAQFLSSGVFHGEVKTRRIVVEKECDFNGSIHMIKSAQRPQQSQPSAQQTGAKSGPQSILKDSKSAPESSKLEGAKT